MDEETPKIQGTDPNSHLRIDPTKKTITQIPESDDTGYERLRNEAEHNPTIIGTSTDLVNDSQLIPNEGDLPKAN